VRCGVRESCEESESRIVSENCGGVRKVVMSLGRCVHPENYPTHAISFSLLLRRLTASQHSVLKCNGNFPSLNPPSAQAF
jgi:hypothetical protein